MTWLPVRPQVARVPTVVEWDSVPDESNTGYLARAALVYWSPSFPACRARGDHSARCLLNPGHEGDHYGNGFDSWGPMSARRWEP